MRTTGAWYAGDLPGTDCCLLAYGQTGSGKSYSIFGDAHDEGILMRSMRGRTATDDLLCEWGMRTLRPARIGLFLNKE